MRKILVAVVAVLGIVGLASCGDKTQLNDAPVGKIDDSPAFIMTNPDQFPNIAFRCLGVNGIYATTRTGANGIIVVTNDPQCGSGAKDTTTNGNGGK